MFFEYLLIILAPIIAGLVFGCLLNPFFWQSFRNTKFWDSIKDDEYEDTDLTDLANIEDLEE